MHPVVIDQPYEFVPPYDGRIWPPLLQWFVRRRLRIDNGMESLQFEHLDRLKESMAAGHAVVLTPNHCRPTDPAVVNELCRRVGVVPFTMASWHVFMQGKLQRFILQRIGGFSVYREGLDRKALRASIDILRHSHRPLVIFPEGVITRTNDRLLSLMEGGAFVARFAARKLLADGGHRKVVIHPVAIRYRFHGDIDLALRETLDDIEQRLSWQPRRDADNKDRIRHVGEALLGLKEMEFLGAVQPGTIGERLESLINEILGPLESEWLGRARHESPTVARVKILRKTILRDMITGTLDDQEKDRRWGHLAKMYVAQQMSHYPPDYISSHPTSERMLETVERFEEDLTDQCRIHRPMSATATVGEAIEVGPEKVRGMDEDPVMNAINRQLHDMLEITPPGQ